MSHEERRTFQIQTFHEKPQAPDERAEDQWNHLQMITFSDYRKNPPYLVLYTKSLLTIFCMIVEASHSKAKSGKAVQCLYRCTHIQRNLKNVLSPVDNFSATFRASTFCPKQRGTSLSPMTQSLPFSFGHDHED